MPNEPSIKRLGETQCRDAFDGKQTEKSEAATTAATASGEVNGGVDTICDNQISIEMVEMHNIRIENGNRN